MKIKTINSVNDLKNKKIFVRVDFNVPMEKGKVKEEFKMTASLPMLNFLIKKGAILILATHLGDPKFTPAGRIKDKEKFTTKPLALKLSKLLGKKVVWLEADISSKKNKEILAKMKSGQVALLENLRFDVGETKNNTVFAKKLASVADLYINNAFAVSHRDHASVSAIKKYLPSYAGSLVEEEVLNLQKVVYPAKPLVAIIGGAKIDTKVALIKNLSKKADYVLVGGAIANNFLAARKLPIGKSVATPENIKIAKKIDNKKIILPIDVLVASKNQVDVVVRKVEEVASGDCIYDIGPETMKLYASYIKKAKTIAWNGPMGWFENPKFKQGTLFIGRAMAAHTKGRAFGLVGGGETVEALKETKMLDNIDWVSTGGGASLSFLGGEKMPGLKNLIK